ncbi:3-hydroxyisobutyryl-coenzyme A hydrolase isoform 1 [Roridomyces roridus]|uniref:3-hydroxyisobutyryl-CoA hydrolase n=1 Tax=Roridomyces roridus TaxID=1738132 RepID=A0AAD7BXB7_9AGAR|nr:3-hydroxyisobutyryl-coenzyme A hydrolase isoform 1 [Roridomyces roridus]
MLAASTRFMSRRVTALNRTRAIARHMSDVAGSKPPSGAEAEPVVRFESTLALRNFILNRPKKLNALNDEMLALLRPKIEEWDNAELCNVIAGTGTGRAFCAGGDVQGVVQAAADESTRQKAINFFKQEFDLDLLLSSLQKPYVAILDGLTMGGGVGLVAGAPFRVATENTVFSMPETNIGYCTYLALTSDTIKGRAVFDHGFATHYIPSRRIPMLLDRLSNLETTDRTTIDRTLEELCTEREQEEPLPPFVGEKRAALDLAFRHDRVERIFTELEGLSTNPSTEISEWASKTLETLQLRSPTSLKVALKAIRLGKTQTLAEALNMELKIATAFCNGASPDFGTGVTAVLVTKSKGRPDWKPSSVEEVTDEIVERFFSPHSKYLANAPTVELDAGRGASERTQLRYTLPTEDDIRDVITGADPDSGDMGYTLDDLLEYYHDSRAGKLGVAEKILEVVERKTSLVDNKDGNYVWLRWNP